MCIRDRTPTCDRHRQTDTDSQTHGHGIYRESIARTVKTKRQLRAGEDIEGQKQMLMIRSADQEIGELNG